MGGVFLGKAWSRLLVAYSQGEYHKYIKDPTEHKRVLSFLCGYVSCDHCPLTIG